MEKQSESLIKIDQLCKNFLPKSSLFSRDKRVVKALDNVSFGIEEGECFGVVGESGCGKSTLGRSLLRLIEPTSGKVTYRDHLVTNLSKSGMMELRRKMQIIFQDPYSSLNPKMRVEDLVMAPLDVFKIGSKQERRDRVYSMLKDVGLDETALKRFPHEFSGGQRQRIMIARALIMEPDFVVCDEPVSALDVSVRAQVLNLMCDLQKKRNLSYLFISHDLSVVKHISSRIAVMYLGEIVEIAGKTDLYQAPKHPYTESLLASIPISDPSEKRLRKQRIIGEIPSSYNHPKGCKFHTRCPYKKDICSQQKPELSETGDGHQVRCHFPL